MSVPKSKSVKAEASLAAERWQTHRETWRILHSDALSPREKLEQCNQTWALHSAAHADVEIYPVGHPVRVEREALLEKLPNALARAARTQKNREHGQEEMQL